MSTSDDQPLAWWEEVQVNLLLTWTKTNAPHLFDQIKEATRTPAGWRAFRERMRTAQRSTADAVHHPDD